MRKWLRWTFGGAVALLVAVPFALQAQAAYELRVGVGQHVRVYAVTGDTVEGFVRLWKDDRILVRRHGFASDTIVAFARSDVSRVELAVPQANSLRNAAIGGVVGFTVGTLVMLAFNKEQTCSYPGECVRISGAIFPLLGLPIGLVSGWLQRPEAWVPLLH